MQYLKGQRLQIRLLGSVPQLQPLNIQLGLLQLLQEFPHSSRSIPNS